MLTRYGWVEVRAADEADSRRVAAVLRRCYPVEAWTEAAVDRFVGRDGRHVRVMTLDERIIGAVLYRHDADTVQIARLAVSPQFRGCRVAAHAIRTLTGPRGPVRSGVYEALVHETNAAAISLMKKCGFDATGVVREHYRDGRDAYVFRLYKEATIRHRALVQT